MADFVIKTVLYCIDHYVILVDMTYLYSIKIIKKILTKSIKINKINKIYLHAEIITRHLWIASREPYPWPDDDSDSGEWFIKDILFL